MTARLEALAEPGGICVSARVPEDIAGKLDLAFEDLGEQALKNIARPVRTYRVATASASTSAPETPALPLPDKPSIAVLPFANMSGDPEQEYFADGMVEDVITALSRDPSLFVIARNSSFTYKGRAGGHGPSEATCRIGGDRPGCDFMITTLAERWADTGISTGRLILAVLGNAGNTLSLIHI